MEQEALNTFALALMATTERAVLPFSSDPSAGAGFSNANEDTGAEMETETETENEMEGDMGKDSNTDSEAENGKNGKI
ncbi:hypothetical protein BGX26_003379 [Mortierella sp. AD094]|nr:hypothetical protein BGX26_003379 [Mortierella sp. AD094]